MMDSVGQQALVIWDSQWRFLNWGNMHLGKTMINWRELAYDLQLQTGDNGSYIMSLSV